MNQDDNSNKIGVVAATLMVAGNMMGSGVFMLPANLAAIGGVAVFGWIVTCIGAIALALTFAKLSSIDPAAAAMLLIGMIQLLIILSQTGAADSVNNFKQEMWEVYAREIKN